MSSHVGTLLGSSMPHGTQAAAGLRLRRMWPLIEIQSRPSGSRSMRIAFARCFFSIYSSHSAVGSQIWPSASITRFAICFLPGNVLLMTQPIRIAVLNFAHETVTFLPNDTTLADFVYDGSPARGEALLSWEPRSYMGGFVKVAREHEGVELVGIESPLWPKTGNGSGWITEEAYEHFMGKIVAELKTGGPWHGVYLALHGAMGVRGVARPEADIARRVREVVGRSAFIAGTFDPHGNEDEEFLKQSDFAFCVKYFPHYDSRLQGERAARMLIRAIRGDYRPT